MTTINFNNKEYELESLSDSAKATVMSLQFVQNEIKRLEGKIAISKTAETAYLSALQEELGNE